MIQIFNHTLGINNMSMFDDKTRKKKSIYDTKFLKTNETGGHPKYLHANTPHISFFFLSRKVLPVVLFVLEYSVRQTKRQHFPVAFYVLPAKKGLRHLDQ